MDGLAEGDGVEPLMLSVDDRSLGDTLGLALGFCDAFVSSLVLALPLEFEFTVASVRPELDGAPPVSRPFEICAVAGAMPMTSAASETATIETYPLFMRIPRGCGLVGVVHPGVVHPPREICTAGASLRPWGRGRSTTWAAL